MAPLYCASKKCGEEIQDKEMWYDPNNHLLYHISNGCALDGFEFPLQESDRQTPNLRFWGPIKKPDMVPEVYRDMPFLEFEMMGREEALMLRDATEELPDKL